MIQVELKKKAVEKFCIPQLIHSQDTLLASMNLNTPVWICWHCMWNHLSQLSQHTAPVFQVTALPQVPQGHLGVLGPGLVSVSKALASSKIKMYLYFTFTGLPLFTLS